MDSRPELDSHLDTGFDGGCQSEYPVPVREMEIAFQRVYQARPPKARTGEKIVVAPASEIPPGSRRIVEAGPFSIGVFNLAGKYYAIRNHCPHMGAALCEGSIHGTHRPSAPETYEPDLEGRVIRCPWHGWEFDIPSGKGLYDEKSRVRTYAVEIDDEGNVVIRL